MRVVIFSYIHNINDDYKLSLLAALKLCLLTSGETVKVNLPNSSGLKLRFNLSCLYLPGICLKVVHFD